MALRTHRFGRAFIAAAVTATAFTGPLLSASPAHAAREIQSPEWFNRKHVIERALTWTSKGIPYSQTGWYRGYRRDCSGFVSMAWGLDQSYVTWTLPEVAVRISKEQLKPGDIMLDTVEHVVIFGNWADKAHTKYWCYEQAGSSDRAIRHVVPYPFRVPGNYQPYRYTGGHTVDGHNIFSPKSKLDEPHIQTYAGGAPLVPSDAVQARRVHAAAVAARQKRWEDQARVHYAKVAAEKRAAAAKAKAKAATADAAKKVVQQTGTEVALVGVPGAGAPAAPDAAKRAAPATPQAPTTHTPSCSGQPVIVTILRSVFGWILR